MRERVIAELADRQYGVVTRVQLLAAGLSSAGIGRWVAAGRLFPVHRGVYAVGRPAITRSGHLIAAQLACGSGAALSHTGATEWWQLTGRRAHPIEVTVPALGGRRCPGVRVHRSESLPRHVVVRRRIAVTSVERTVLDMAARCPRREVERLVDEAQRLGLFERERFASVLTERRPGTALLGQVLAEHEAGSTWTRNDFEEAFLTLVDRAGLPRPLMNWPVGPYVIDCYWTDRRLAVELDGRETHLTPRAFEGDRDRDAYLFTEHGIHTLRFTYRQVTLRAAVVSHRLRRALLP